MNTKIYILLAVVLLCAACENQETDFDDFGTTACYFPYQTPARTLILGRYDLGYNDNDNNYAFEIGVTMGGVQENARERKVHFRLAPELLDSAENIFALPANYYTIETESPVTIPAGSTKGRIRVQLTEQFFEDPLSIAPLNMINYVIPLLITEAENLDTVLSGLPLVENPTRVIAADWSVLPKDYTLYGIKFINEYHAVYLRRGVDIMSSLSGGTDSTVYHAKYVEEDELVAVTTTGRRSVVLSNLIRRGSKSNGGSVSIELLFDENGNGTVQDIGGPVNNASGSGTFVENGDFLGGNPQDVLYLQYAYTDTVNNETHNVYDTLVVRNRNVVFEEFVVE